MLKNILREIMESRKEKTVVAVITGDLQLGFRKLSVEKALIRFEVDAAKEQHNLNVLRENIVDGVVDMEVDALSELASSTWKTKNAVLIADWNKRADAAKTHEKELWRQIYEKFGLDPDGEYSVNAQTGEVSLA